jgi:hypothetical protein
MKKVTITALCFTLIMGTMSFTVMNESFSTSENGISTALNKTGKVTINNKTGKDIYVYEEGSRNSSTIRANSSGKFDCDHNYTYKFDPNSSGKGSQCYSANSACGSSVTVK